jgi:hypothetical protein
MNVTQNETSQDEQLDKVALGHDIGQNTDVEVGPEGEQRHMAAMNRSAVGRGGALGQPEQPRSRVRGLGLIAIIM